MRIRVQYYASLRDLLATPSEEVSLGEGMRVEELMGMLMEIHRPLKGVGRILIAVNGEYVPMDRVLREGDQVALFPPVSGG